MDATYARSRFLPRGCTRPSDASLAAFYAAARAALPERALPEAFCVRWIGGDAASTDAILGHIVAGAKTGTVTVPQALEATGQPQTRVDDAIVLIRCDGTPVVLVQITNTEIVPFAEISEAHTALDGPRVRALEVWKRIHEPYFNMLLAPHGLVCTAATPISVETFELLYVDTQALDRDNEQ